MKTPSSFSKSLLVRPLGGLNDVLCQIEFARRIALRTGRRLIVQTETGSPGLRHRFAQKFSEIFEFVDKGSELEIHSLFTNQVRPLSVWPVLYSSFGSWLEKSLEEFTKGTQVQSRLDHTYPRNYDLAVHEGFGGGPASFSLLEHVRLKNSILLAYEKAHSELPENCVAVHFRNTDYRSSYEYLSESISLLDPEKSVLLASDDESSFNRIRADHPNRVIIFASAISMQSGLAQPTELAVLELLLIAKCEDLILIPIQWSDSNAEGFSGFGRLCQHVWSVRQIQNLGTPTLIRHTLELSLESKRRRRNPFRFGVFVVLRGSELWRQAFFPRGLYKQLKGLG
jgi:hypothetical protein